MEASVIGISQVKLRRTDLVHRHVGFFNIYRGLNANKVCLHKSRIYFGQSIRLQPKSPIRFTLRASAARSEVVMSEKASGDMSTRFRKAKPIDGTRLYVGLPLDTVSDCNTINHARAIAAGLKALKLLGVDGVELPVWWGIAEKDAMGKYEWSCYLALAECVQKVGLKLHVSLCFHAAEESKIPLPKWVSRIGETQPNIFFKDMSGQHYKDCLSLAVDDIPVLDGKTPMEVYKEFCDSFKTSFSPFMGSTITGISIGLGPDGELRYPSHRHPGKRNTSRVGEFLCYDENMLSHLKQHAETLGNPLWGLSGPHDATGNDQSPMYSNFFKEHGGSWETPYGDFFLSWYSSQLLSHGDRLLSLAASIFSDVPVTVSGKVPLMHSWYRTRSHPSELTSGFYNTDNRNGYEAVAKIFSRNSCKMILPGMDLSDEYQPYESRSSPELLLHQIVTSCKEHGVEISGQNSLVSGAPRGFEQIKKKLLGENAVVDLFTYQRMGAYFFSPEHFPSFTEFVRSLNQPELHSDDLPVDDEAVAECLPGKKLQIQTA